MFKEREIIFTTNRMYVKPYTQKIKSIIWISLNRHVK